MIRVRIKIDGLVRKCYVARKAVPIEAEAALRGLADEALALVRNAPEGERRALIERQVERSLDAVFVPVPLKHKRPETWPTLRPIYQARIVRNSPTYRGRKLFWVDENKRDALAAELMHRALEARQADRYEVRFVATYDRRYRLEIVRHGGKGIPSVVIAYARQRMKYVAAETLTGALSRAGLMKGRSAGSSSHRYYDR